MTSSCIAGNPISASVVGECLPSLFEMSSTSRIESHIDRYRNETSIGVAPAMGHRGTRVALPLFDEDRGKRSGS